MSTGEFESSDHKTKWEKDSAWIKAIDGLHSYGGLFFEPDLEITELNMQIDGVKVHIPKDA